MANRKTLDEKIQDAHAKAGYPSGEAFEDGFRRGYAAGLREARNALDEQAGDSGSGRGDGAHQGEAARRPRATVRPAHPEGVG